MDHAKIISGPLPERYARGWHCVGPALKFKDGKPHTVDAFGTRLAVFQSTDGKLNALDAWCPHMGGDLSHGRIKGDTVVCPFHGWGFGTDGKVKEIPYCERLPPKAKVAKWPTLEVNESLYVWHDADGGAPIPGQEIPQIEQLLTPEFSEVRWAEFAIATNNRELVDNISDLGHFDETHQSRCEYFANLFDGHKATQVMISTSRIITTEKQAPLSTHATYFGPAVLLVELVGEWNGNKIETVYILANTPVTQNSMTIHFGVAVKHQAHLSKAENQAMVDQWVRLQQEALTTDVAIWSNKVRIDNPILCESDGNIYHARKWYDQFFQPIDKIDPESVKHLEYEKNFGYAGPAPQRRHLR
ncbi:MAG: Rieske 2Fe-2S domain-containing protein [Proteobacteria bacterium]|nr:Rieske 2Fe-2S domain-containing protein [Pseudomonadota bacterium]HQR02538.1 Rieske 2Fe-2S domain-containing protein [Rhodocyclaceae bacterium]